MSEGHVLCGHALFLWGWVSAASDRDGGFGGGRVIDRATF
ncbi:hypothetical protein KIS4809_5307 [Bacillus sp. ZZV12-4809]|nr:hypothetical protein KIS4809_5307 [Bacillus sp. ZZV12-4809]